MSTFRYVHTVRFSEVDRAGVAFFSRFFEWAHHAWEALLTEAFGAWFDHMEGAGFGLPLVSASAEFRRPARLSTEVSISIYVKQHDARRVALEFRMQSPDGVELARIEHVHAFIDLATFRPADGDPGFIARLLECGLEPLPEPS